MARRINERPVSIEVRWFTSYRRNPFEDYDDYEYIVHWADGSVDILPTLPRRWMDIPVGAAK